MTKPFNLFLLFLAVKLSGILIKSFEKIEHVEEEAKIVMNTCINKIYLLWVFFNQNFFFKIKTTD